MKATKAFLGFLVLNLFFGLAVFSHEASAARVMANRDLIMLTFRDDGELMVRLDRASLRGRTRPDDLDKSPVFLLHKGNGYCQAPNFPCVDAKFVLQSVKGNSRELEFPARLIQLDEDCQCFRFTTGRPDSDGFVRKNWTFTFELRDDQVGGGIRKVSNPPMLGIIPGTTSFAINIPRNVFEMFARTSLIHVEGKFLRVPVDIVPFVVGDVLLGFAGKNWCADRNNLCTLDQQLFNNGKGFFEIPICQMRGFPKDFNIGVSSQRNGLITDWASLSFDRLGTAVKISPNGVSYIVDMTDSQIEAVCR